MNQKRYQSYWTEWFYSLTVSFIVFAFICAMEKFPVKQLNANDSEYELKQQIYDQNIDNIFQWADYTVENCFQLGNSLDGF